MGRCRGSGRTAATTTSMRPTKVGRIENSKSYMDMVGEPNANPDVLPSIAVWRSVRAGGAVWRSVRAGRRHQDQEVTPHIGTSSTVHHRIADPPCVPGGSPGTRRSGVARPRSRVCLGSRYPARGARRTARVPQGPSGRSPPGGLDTTGDETQLRVVVACFRRRTGRHRPAGRPQRHGSHRGRLPQTNPTGDGAGGHSNEPDLPRGKLSC